MTAKKTRSKKKFDLQELENYGFRGLAISEICAIAGINISHFYSRCEKEPELREAIDRGRAKVVNNLAVVVLQHALGKEEGGKVVIPKDAKLCMQALDRLSKHWAPSTKVEHQGSIDTSGSGAPVLDVDTATRGAIAFLRSQGIRVQQ